MTTEIRWIDTSGLPPGYDAADLVAELKGDTAAIIAWYRARVRLYVAPPLDDPTHPDYRPPKPNGKANGQHHPPPAAPAAQQAISQPAIPAATPEPAAPTGPPRQPRARRSRKPPVNEPLPPVSSHDEACADGSVDLIPSTENTGLGYVGWESLGLKLNNAGIPLPNLNNAAAIIENHPALAGKIWYDEFLQRILTTWDSDQPREWRDDDDIRLALFVQRALAIGKMSVESMRHGVIAVAFGRKRNECREWMLSLKWDGTKRLRELMSRGFGSVSNAYTQAVAVYWLCAMCKRVLKPGCKADNMPVFEGAQGIFKSTALSIIGGKWFAEFHDEIRGKDFYEVLGGKMLVEIGEMHAFSAAEVTQIKGKISCCSDRYRSPYGRHTNDHPRMCVFSGSTNHDDWNRDETGARRFYPIKCGTIDLHWIRANRDQLFAEAIAELRVNKLWWVVPKEDAKREQESRRAHDSWEGPITSYLAGRTSVRIGEMLRNALEMDFAKQGRAEQMRAGRCLRALGWRSETVWKDGRSERFWVPEDQLALVQPAADDGDLPF